MSKINFCRSLIIFLLVHCSDFILSSAIYCEDHFSEFREYQKSNLKTQVKTRKRTENFNKTPTPFELEFVKPFKTLNKRKIKNHQFLSNFEISISQSFFFFISSTATNPPIISIDTLKYKYTSIEKVGLVES
jgi:hypothetical protein